MFYYLYMSLVGNIICSAVHRYNFFVTSFIVNLSVDLKLFNTIALIPPIYSNNYHLCDSYLELVVKNKITLSICSIKNRRFIYSLILVRLHAAGGDTLLAFHYFYHIH